LAYEHNLRNREVLLSPKTSNSCSINLLDSIFSKIYHTKLAVFIFRRLLQARVSFQSTRDSEYYPKTSCLTRVQMPNMQVPTDVQYKWCQLDNEHLLKYITDAKINMGYVLS
jgi:hypothetical protein